MNFWEEIICNKVLIAAGIILCRAVERDAVVATIVDRCCCYCCSFRDLPLASTYLQNRCNIVISFEFRIAQSRADICSFQAEFFGRQQRLGQHQLSPENKREIDGVDTV